MNVYPFRLKSSLISLPLLTSRTESAQSITIRHALYQGHDLWRGRITGSLRIHAGEQRTIGSNFYFFSAGNPIIFLLVYTQALFTQHQDSFMIFCNFATEENNLRMTCRKAEQVDPPNRKVLVTGTVIQCSHKGTAFYGNHPTF